LKYFLTILFCCTLLSCGFGQGQVKPTNYGGKAEFKRLFREQIQYPKEALSAGKEGVVDLVFVVDTNGTTRDLKVWRSDDPAFEAEAKRLFKKLLWNPGFYGDMPYAFEHTLHFRFTVDGYKRMCKKRGYASRPLPELPVDSTNIVHNEDKITIAPRPLVNDSVVVLSRYISKNLAYPPLAFKHSISGVAILYFVVEPDGLVTNIRPKKHLGAGCTEEASRLLQTLSWTPGIKDGQLVRTAMTITMNFRLPNERDVEASHQPNDY